MQSVKWLGVRVVAERLGVARTTVYALCQRQKIAHIRVGPCKGAIRISEEALEEYIRRTTVALGEASEQGEE